MDKDQTIFVDDFKRAFENDIRIADSMIRSN